ncbi:MAG: 4-hydroxythreonine-4-phosphate dehydrogenase [Elusimicrobia bacterium]|nr:MAG: 4-hydroxythreonine-4-phosphate dehydrogenase [Elusimicrobiota bacterium]KAF0153709.1 MAG: 4-hydroxythreonine-4-phosphate dehydrogenase [Elusimicrobiota bacterium]
MKRRPLIVITAGDPGGIGPEITASAVAFPAVRRACSVAVIGCRRALLRAGLDERFVPVMDIPGPSAPPRRPDARSGRASYLAVKAAFGLVSSGLADALVTAPVCKEAWLAAGLPQTSHTDFFRARLPAEPLMAFSSGPLNAALLTEHLPLSRAAAAITRKSATAKLVLFSRELSRLLGRKPRLGLCALNPHAGEGGLLGGEERKVLAPAARAARGAGALVEGPLPGDAAWALHKAGKLDGLMCCYHDQAITPIKLLAGMERTVHLTLGLPFVRTSPAHGTAFDMAGKGKADWRGMAEAILSAARLSSR